jgi:hypothetical protein
VNLYGGEAHFGCPRIGPGCAFRDGRGKRKPPTNPRRFYAPSDFKFRQRLFQPFLSFARVFFYLFTVERQQPPSTFDARAAR